MESRVIEITPGYCPQNFQFPKKFECVEESCKCGL